MCVGVAADALGRPRPRSAGPAAAAYSRSSSGCALLHVGEDARAEGLWRGRRPAGPSAAPRRAIRQARQSAAVMAGLCPGRRRPSAEPPESSKVVPRRRLPNRCAPLRHLKVRRVVMEGLAGVAIGDTRSRCARTRTAGPPRCGSSEQAQSGDLLAFERLYRDNERKVFGLCFRLSSDPALAEELTQEVFVRAWRKLVELPRRERLLLLALPADGERGAQRAPLAAAPRRADRRDRGPGEPRAGAARARAGGGLRPREGDGGAAARARAPCSCSTTWRAGLTRRSRRCWTSRPGTSKAQLLPRPPAAQGGTRLMTCHELDERLDDWRGRRPRAGPRPEVESHLAACARVPRARAAAAPAARARRGAAPLRGAAARPVARDRRADRARLGLVGAVRPRGSPLALAAAAAGRARPRGAPLERLGPDGRAHGGDAERRARAATPWRARGSSDPVLAAAERDYEEAAQRAARGAAAAAGRAAGRRTWRASRPTSR